MKDEADFEIYPLMTQLSARRLYLRTREAALRRTMDEETSSTSKCQLYPYQPIMVFAKQLIHYLG
jgi:hypothetical protein